MKDALGKALRMGTFTPAREESAGMVQQGDETKLDAFKTRVAEHGWVKAVLESFAYIKPFGGMFGKIVPFYAESYWYAMGGLTFLMFCFLTGSGVILALLGPYWWLTNPVGGFL